MSSRFVVSAALAASVFAGGALGDIGTPTWNWGSYGSWGHGYTATYGQTFLGNGEFATGVRVKFYNDPCCNSWPYKAFVCRWDDSTGRAIAPVLAQADAVYSNQGCCWTNEEIQFDSGLTLESGVRYVVFFTVTPTWNSYCCRSTELAVHSDSQYWNGTFVRISNGANQAAWFNSAWSGSGYDLDFTVRTTNDCDENGVIDVDEILKGSAEDCNEDQIIDSCQGNVPQNVSLAGTQGPIGTGIERQFLFEDVVPSNGAVTLTVEASGDLSATHEFLLLSVAGGTPTPIFTGAQADCSPLTAQFTYNEAQFDQFILGGDLDVRISASGTVDPTACGGSSSVTVRVEYRERYSDCNGNGVPDPVDICSTATPDCNDNFIPDSCDIATNFSRDLDANAQPDECQSDCNADERPDVWQIATGELPDCNQNGILDVCDLSSGASQDCNGNSIPDSCDIVAGVSADCDVDGVPDACAITSWSVPDCDENGVPDSCDVQSGAAGDCDANGVPDSCDVSSSAVQFVSYRQTPFYSGYPLVDMLKNAPMVSVDPVIELNYLAYTYGYYGQYVRVYLDGNSVIGHYDYYWGSCWNGTRSWSISRDSWNEAAADGQIEVRVEVNSSNNCSGSTCQLRVRFANSPDCNSNSIPDSCDLESGTAPDCNGNGLIDTCEITSGAEDKNQNGHLDACELARGDLDLDGVVGGGDLAVLLSLWGVTGSPVGDLNGDGVIDAMDATILLGNWGTTP
jgi:hypothetical protein